MPLTIQYCSDLHLEFDLNRKWVKKYPLIVKGDILLLGGDIVLFSQIEQHADFFDFVSANYKAAYWIPGNHEYYNSDIADRGGAVHEAIRHNVYLVNNTTVTVGNVDIICATLWSKVDPAHEYEITRAMSDFHIIRNGANRLRINDYNELHRQGRVYLEGAIADSAALHKVVLTYHVPTMMNYPEKYRGDVLNEAFVTELYDLIDTSGADCWIYGHTHYNTPEFAINNTKLLTNQLGYVKHGEHSTFGRDRVIVV